MLRLLEQNPCVSYGLVEFVNSVRTVEGVTVLPLGHDGSRNAAIARDAIVS